MWWLIGGALSLLLFGGSGWVFWRSQSVHVERADRAKEKVKKTEGILSNVKKAKKVALDIARITDAERRKWMQKLTRRK